MFSAVNALRAIKKSLIDPYHNLGSWNRGDPCTSRWAGISCYNTTLDDDYFHVREMYDFSFFSCSILQLIGYKIG